MSCLLHRGLEEAQLATTNRALQLRVMTELVNGMHYSLTKGKGVERIPAYIGTVRDQTVQKMTGCPDPYASLKRQSNETALRLLPKLEDFVEAAKTSEIQFQRACIAASLGNVIEYGVSGHEIPWDTLDDMVSCAQEEMAIDETSLVWRLLQNTRSALFLTDNAGEIVFDRPLLKIISELGIKVTVAVKGAPVLNDATLEDASSARLDEFSEVITTGGSAVGVIPRWCSKDFLSRFDEVDLVIAKGMGHWETLPEFSVPKPTAHLLRTKCEPVARSLGVSKGHNIVKLLKPHKGRFGPLTAK
ncbi:MAG: DUF89 domain-containing protein [Promethearchaeota archaeon]